MAFRRQKTPSKSVIYGGCAITLMTLSQCLRPQCRKSALANCSLTYNFPDKIASGSPSMDSPPGIRLNQGRGGLPQAGEPKREVSTPEARYSRLSGVLRNGGGLPGSLKSDLAIRHKGFIRQEAMGSANSFCARFPLPILPAFHFLLFQGYR
jgi:hypothetical protein